MHFPWVRRRPRLLGGEYVLDQGKVRLRRLAGGGACVPKYADVAQTGRRAASRTLLLEVQILSSASKQAGMAQKGRRGSFKNCLLKVRVLLPALSERSSNGRARACQARGWEFKSPRSFQTCYLFFQHVWPSGIRRWSAEPVRSVRFRWRAPVFAEGAETGRRAELKPPQAKLRVRVPPSASQFLRAGKCPIGSHKPDALGSLPRPATNIDGALGKSGLSRQSFKLKSAGSNPARPMKIELLFVTRRVTQCARVCGLIG